MSAGQHGETAPGAAEAGRPRAVFLDFDGTYADHGTVPPEHAEAVRQVRRNGHRVLLCTGRPLSILEPGLRGGFDGLVTSAGARIDIDGQVLSDERLDPDVSRRAVDVLEEARADYVLESPEVMAVPERCLDAVRARFGVLLEASTHPAAATVLEALVAPVDLRGSSVSKISVWDSALPVTELAARVGEAVRPLPNSITGDAARSGELQNARIDKADGVRLVARHLGLDLADTVGAGDGMNDVGMLQVVGAAIAIEGSPPEVLAPADLVVPGPTQAGLVEAFARLGLL